jgi:hypothetical protein
MATECTLPSTLQGATAPHVERHGANLRAGAEGGRPSVGNGMFTGGNAIQLYLA